ncbi:tRNA preQ1(34) S-adenosylmethionine ribosyltransferase-isomerase QueA [Ferrovibrio sp.]|uniref:tRNA preQ1(34) S-adenosylmethionine ribosyltransferase-isomerase QueA n=1 Tax=Ferrovibrio sp. TaxID=1917215 RepID=UPI001B3F1A2E|nr:tRNA preQ1(34) S-adenosylmethionine ribosyltransferase-isomerase QueA [Ferrovibrio sp.]MBP7065522.1 tRNA preQ1(34) S-adenosylmethionine ribosyltransferase-isomerase QueA [Ferrovibrio sp.]
MLVDDFDFALPAHLVAERPAVPRDAARLLLWPGDGAEHSVRDLPDLLRPGDLLVFNDTKVIPARLYGRREREPFVAAEALLLKALGGRLWSVMAKPARRFKPGDALLFEGGLRAEVAEKGAGVDGLVLRFDRDDAAVLAALEQSGAMPLPPYIVAQRRADARDREDYQTVYAARAGAIAAPTAGLHFTPELLAALAARGIAQASVTLHVGAGTFLPVKAERVAEHRMHAEWGEVSPATAAAIAKTRAVGGRVVAVGTTSLRLLETAARESGDVVAWSGDTDIFITPGFQFRAVDVLMTNFHLPRSTLVMLVAAFIGWPEQRALYARAIAEGYRFYSYGDSSLLFRNPS